jgi:hypothetical protein
MEPRLYDVTLRSTGPSATDRVLRIYAYDAKDAWFQAEVECRKAWCSTPGGQFVAAEKPVGVCVADMLTHG